MIHFEWDENKAASNLEKHGVSFVEATSIFSDPLSLTIPDPLHSGDEERFVTLGRTSDNMLVVIHTDRDGTIRIISAREATSRERRNYER